MSRNKLMKYLVQWDYYLVLIVISSLIFCSIYGVYVLNPTYTDWLLSGGDLSQHYLGWEAYRNSSWHFPLGMSDVISYPSKTSIIFTDSIPWFALIFKVLSPILPENFQFFGIWGIMCFMLQSIFSARVFRYFTSNKVIIVVSSLGIVVAPIMIWRMFAHTSLAAHWILLLGLEAIFSYNFSNNLKKTCRVVIIMGMFAAATHLYFVVMCGFILVGICVLDLVTNKQIKGSIVLALAYSIVVSFVIWIFGGFGSGMHPTAGGLGNCGMNLNALFNPQGWSVIYRTMPLWGKDQYEGFAYLGAGMILLLLFAIILFMGNGKLYEILKRHWKVLLALSVVTIMGGVFAISPVVTLGDKLLIEINCPEVIYKCWSVFRATGRMSWVLVYIILIATYIILFRLMKLKILLITIMIGLIIQIYDIHDILEMKRNEFGQCMVYDDGLYNREFWNGVASDPEIKHVVFCSPITQSELYAIANWALDNEMTLNHFYFARSNVEVVTANIMDALGNLTSDNIYIFKKQDSDIYLKYDLKYVEVDGFVIGYVNELPTYLSD